MWRSKVGAKINLLINFLNKYFQRKNAFFAIILAIIVLLILKAVFDEKVFGYKNLINFSPNNKPGIFKKDVQTDLLTVSSLKNFRNDTLLCFDYKGKYSLVCWILEEYKDLKLANIKEGTPIELKAEDLNTYRYFGGKDFPLRISTKVRLPKSSHVSMIFNSCDTIREKYISKNILLCNLKCNEIGFVTKKNYRDITFVRSNWESFADFMILKAKNRFYILLLFSTDNEDVSADDLLNLLNPECIPSDFDFKERSSGKSIK